MFISSILFLLFETRVESRTRLMGMQTALSFQKCDVTRLHDTGWNASCAVVARDTHGSGALGETRRVSTESVSLGRRQSRKAGVLYAVRRWPTYVLG